MLSLLERKTPLADVRGQQTAVVAGAEGEEIDCDEYGRILVRFHWDLDKANSMRCRVSQSWAGNGWGGMVIPRVGMEVVVEFLDGDPDQPLVTGCVYNGRNKVPYDLPANKTRSTFKTDTHQGTGFNELRFEDEKGREEIFVHAQRDRNEKVRNNHTERIDNNWVQSIGRNKVIDVDGNHDEVISGQKSIHVGGSRVGVSVSRALKELTGGISEIAAKLPIPGLRDATSGVFNVLVEKVMNVSVLGMSNETVGVSKNILAGRTINMSAGSTITVDASQILALSGNVDASISSSGSISLTCGDSAITLGSNGDIYLQGRNLYVDMSELIEINAGDRMEVSADNKFDVKAKRIDLN
ncbi:type VI secretion system Vgr family protein [Roseinatronobacter alkalisoli]|uniref:Type VI secretion system tip protein TssI/VgrG n=1 Tax=Roseinatronobacter alkalisoli TaxID=3028235 RepID=A0ABT5TFU2_9RHOB|nr:type VI secretion system tip protein TssI/VgrG [Roseinatronobacter sp. HJB301]MDD7973804.1 type VI secretion system tip protein TssI/VgrG [Roseinatronobacter sp. HJB301]